MRQPLRQLHEAARGDAEHFVCGVDLRRAVEDVEGLVFVVVDVQGLAKPAGWANSVRASDRGWPAGRDPAWVVGTMQASLLPP
jgi:hypothetical protein